MPLADPVRPDGCLPRSGSLPEGGSGALGCCPWDHALGGLWTWGPCFSTWREAAEPSPEGLETGLEEVFNGLFIYTFPS